MLDRNQGKNVAMLGAATPVEHFRGIALRRFGSGPTLMLVHGGVGSWTHWQANICALKKRFSLITVDLPGYGSSDDVAAEISADEYLAHVGSLFDALAAENGPFHVAAFSYGAVVSAAVAAARPHTVRAMTLIGPGGFGKPEGRSVSLEKVPPGGPDDPAVRRVVARNLGQWMLSRAPDPESLVIDVQLLNIARTRFDSRRISFQDRLPSDLAQTTCPVQIIWGEKDSLVVPSIEARADRCRAARPDIAIHRVPDAGHWAQFEQPEPINELIAAFHRE